MRRKMMLIIVAVIMLLSAAGANAVARAWEPLCPPAGTPPPC